MNEEKNIQTFCQAYGFSDLILVADGGSTDRTVELAEQFSYVKVRPFKYRVHLPDGSFYNPEPKHFNFLLTWAEVERADWIIYDDCDSRPGRSLRRDARKILAGTYEGTVLVNRVYMWGQEQFFPDLTTGGGPWAWRPGRSIRANESKDNFFETTVPIVESGLTLTYPPYMLIHNFHPDKEQSMNERIKKYQNWGQEIRPILEAHRPQYLPDWIQHEL